MSRGQQEQAKYEMCWSHDEYRAFSPGERIVQHYLSALNIEPCKVIDFGAGTGRASLALHKAGFDVTMIDIADNCLDPEVQQEMGHRLKIGNLWERMDLPRAAEGFCTDVMEHIPPEYVDDVIRNIMRQCDRAFFHICLLPDHFGEEYETELHLTVRPYTWWKRTLEQYAQILDARDLIHNGWFYVSN
jgi:hypothetical protein